MPRGQLVVHLDRREASLSAAAGVLHLRDGDGAHQALPLAEIGLVVVNGSARTDAHALRSLADAGVPMIAIGGRQKQSVAWLGPGLSASVRLRHAQHLAYADPAQRLVLARHCVAAKLQAQHRVALDRLAHGRLPAALQALLGRLHYCTSIEQLRGCEGAAAAQWFAELGPCIPVQWGFKGRARRPPPCPGNALLSYLYAVAGAEAHQAVQETGLDPSLGFLHDIYPGRAALALDLVEPLRPAVDSLVLDLLQSELISPADFSIGANGCLMKKPARLALMHHYAKARLDWPGSDGLSLAVVCRRHVRALAKAIDADAELPQTEPDNASDA